VDNLPDGLATVDLVADCRCGSSQGYHDRRYQTYFCARCGRHVDKRIQESQRAQARRQAALPPGEKKEPPHGPDAITPPAARNPGELAGS
jgi:hypothetical protein